MVAAATAAISENGRGVAHARPQLPGTAAANPAARPLDGAPTNAVKTDRTVSVATLSNLVDQRSKGAADAGADIECIAQVVYLEASSQPLPGQLAVAEVIVNRTRTGGDFPGTACAVANQRGQFFHVAEYHVTKDSQRWRTAVAIARIAQSGASPRVVPGALFFHAAYTRPAWSYRRPLVAEVGGQYFYR